MFTCNEHIRKQFRVKYLAQEMQPGVAWDWTTNLLISDLLYLLGNSTPCELPVCVKLRCYLLFSGEHRALWDHKLWNKPHGGGMAQRHQSCWDGTNDPCKKEGGKGRELHQQCSAARQRKFQMNHSSLPQSYYYARWLDGCLGWCMLVG